MKQILIVIFLAFMIISCSKKSNEVEQEIKYDILATPIRSANKNSIPLNETAESPGGSYKVKISSISKKFKDSDQDWWHAKLAILDSNGKLIPKNTEKLEQED